MFVELIPLLAGRTVMIMLAREDEKSIRVCMIPKKANPDEDPVLTTPLTHISTPEGLGHACQGEIPRPPSRARNDMRERKALGKLRRVPHATGQHAGPSQSRNGGRGQGCARRSQPQGGREAEGEVIVVHADYIGLCSARSRNCVISDSGFQKLWCAARLMLAELSPTITKPAT
jgi:hypothetical protein